MRRRGLGKRKRRHEIKPSRKSSGENWKRKNVNSPSKNNLDSKIKSAKGMTSSKEYKIDRRRKS